jgi:hypothetical protein
MEIANYTITKNNKDCYSILVKISISNSITPTSTGMKLILKIEIIGLNLPSFSKMLEADSTPHHECGDFKSILFPVGFWIESL